MDGPRGCYAKQSESDRERQIPYDLTYMWSQNKTTKYIDTENRLWVAGDGVGAEGMKQVKGSKGTIFQL